MRYAFSEVVSFKYNFFGAEWKWAYTEQRRVAPPLGALAAFQIMVPDLGTVIDLTIKAPTPNELVYQYKVNVDKKLRRAVGGGLGGSPRSAQIRPRSRGSARRPQLVPKRGFVWHPLPNETVSAKFDPPMAVNYFGAGRRPKGGSLLLLRRRAPKGADVEAGTRACYDDDCAAAVGITRRPNEAERFGVNARGSGDWHENTLPQDSWPVNMMLPLGGREAGRETRPRQGSRRRPGVRGRVPRRGSGGRTSRRTRCSRVTRPQIANQAKRLAAFSTTCSASPITTRRGWCPTCSPGRHHASPR